MTLVGASLGGAIALDFAHEFPQAVQKLVLIDAQGFIDGSGPGASLPGPLAKLGISVLGSKVNFPNLSKFISLKAIVHLYVMFYLIVLTHE